MLRVRPIFGSLAAKIIFALLATLTLAVLLGLAVLYVHLNTPKQPTPHVPVKVTSSSSSSQTSTTQTTSSTTSSTTTTTTPSGDVSDSPIDLSLEEYNAVIAEFQALVDTQSPSAALAKLRSYYTTDPKMANSCHGLGHAIGHMGYLKYKNFSTAMGFTDDICGNGYIHGVIEEHFSNITDVNSELFRLCKVGDPNYASCTHGLGHGLMYFYKNEIPQSLPYCNSFGDVYSRGLCSEGVFHENFETNSLVHKARYLNPDNPFYPCEESFVDGYEGVCYYYSGRYIVRLNKTDYVGALKKCAEAPYASDCARGAGVVIVRQNIKNPPLVEYVCSQAPVHLVNSCLSGAVSYYQVNSRSQAATQTEFCNKFNNPYYIDICNQLNGTQYGIVM